MHGSLSQLCVNFSSPTNNIQFPSIFKAHVGEKEKKNKVTFCGTRIENELFLDSCFARDLAGVDTTWEEREKVSPYSH
jgi:hypothetical protein